MLGSKLVSFLTDVDLKERCIIYDANLKAITLKDD